MLSKCSRSCEDGSQWSRRASNEENLSHALAVSVKLYILSFEEALGWWCQLERSTHDFRSRNRKTAWWLDKEKVHNHLRRAGQGQGRTRQGVPRLMVGAYRLRLLGQATVESYLRMELEFWRGKTETNTRVCLLMIRCAARAGCHGQMGTCTRENGKTTKPTGWANFRLPTGSHTKVLGSTICSMALAKRLWREAT